MQGPFDTKRDIPLPDIGTIRDMLTLIRDDLQRVKALERAAELLSATLAEIDMAERRRLAPFPRTLVDMSIWPYRKH
ncbi:MAG: hypothetical protein F9K29_02380 [Hyphomicrobiaceae bacterium]|nr:MAG: hypothetical protein F9K29_02380 [Hyphomicrobiaceae bacterium]